MRHLPRCVSVAALVAVAVMSGPVRAEAQTPHKSPIIEGSFGYAGFVDALAIGGSVRKRIKPRVSIGPEFLVVRGRTADRYVLLAPRPYPNPGDVESGPYADARYYYQENFGALAVMATATFDLTSRTISRRRVVPYVIASGGFLFIGDNSFGGLPLFGVGPAISGGVGARIDLGRFNLGPEILIGPESPLRVGVVFGIR
jgi:hypothetical protein